MCDYIFIQRFMWVFLYLYFCTFSLEKNTDLFLPLVIAFQVFLAFWKSLTVGNNSFRGMWIAIY